MVGSYRNSVARAWASFQRRYEFCDVFRLLTVSCPWQQNLTGTTLVQIAEDIVRYVCYYSSLAVSAMYNNTCMGRAYLSNNKIAVVCSARSSGKKVTGTTSR